VTPLLGAIAAFLVVQFAIGIVVSRRIATIDDYLVAGRRLGPWLATASIFATWFGAETIVGGAAMVHADGLSLATVEPFGYGLCILVTGIVFAVPIWRRRLTTLADLYRERYGVLVERVAAVILIPTSILWAAAQLRAFGQVITVSGTAMSFETGLLIAATVVVAYTVVGGMLADAVTDLIQAGVVTLSLVALLAVVLHYVGGMNGALTLIAAEQTITLRPSAAVPWYALLEAWAIPICGSVVATELISRIIASRSAAVARGATLAAGSLYLLIGGIPILLALLARPAFGIELADAEQVIPTLARTVLPGWLYIVFAGGMVSAILSTVDSTLLIAGGLGAHNLVLPQLRAPSPRTRVRVTRGLVILGGVVAWWLARHAEGVFALVEMASAFGSAGVLVTVCFALFTDFGGPRAAVSTLLGGLLVYIGATLATLETPFLLSLGAALLLYLVVGASERRSRQLALGT
jgi:SSS family solute:Na+ symporter